MDDTCSEISTQLASDHGDSELNLGFLTRPRRDGKGSPRGEGAELRSNMTVAIQGTQGVLINAGDKHGRQLARDSLVNVAQSLQGLTTELDSVASQHEAQSAEGDSLQALIGKTVEWDVGTNVSPGAGGVYGGGAPIVAANGEAGAMLTSANSVLVGSQSRVDVASVGDVQASAGRSLFLRAARTLQIFAAKLGIKLIAGSGNIQIEADNGEIVIRALKKIRIVSGEDISLEAPILGLRARGAGTDYGGGKITHQSSGAHTIKASELAHLGPGESALQELKLPSAAIEHDQQVLLTDMLTHEPLPNQRYRITVEDGSVHEGVTDSNGLTKRFVTDIGFAKYTVEILD
jgi:type VI secretion system secreted protein VgrG